MLEPVAVVVAAVALAVLRTTAVRAGTGTIYAPAGVAVAIAAVMVLSAAGEVGSVIVFLLREVRCRHFAAQRVLPWTPLWFARRWWRRRLRVVRR